MISSLNADGRPSVWFNLTTDEVRGWGYSTFEYDTASEAVEPVDPALTFDLGAYSYTRTGPGAFRAELKPKTRLEQLRNKRRAGQVLTGPEQQEVFDSLLGV